MSQENVSSTDNNCYDSPPSYDEVCSSNTDAGYSYGAAPESNCDVTAPTSDDKNNTTCDAASIARERGNEKENCKDETKTKDDSPSAPPREMVEGDVPEDSRTENRDEVTIPIIGHSGMYDYSRTDDYNRVMPSRISHYTPMTPRQNRHTVLNDRETEESGYFSEKFKFQFFKWCLWLAVGFVFLGLIIGIAKGANFSRSNRYHYDEHYRPTTESDADRIFRVNPYFNGQLKLEDAAKEMNETLNRLHQFNLSLKNEKND